MFGWLRRNSSDEASGRREVNDAAPTAAERRDELLSAYLDDDLTVADAAELEGRLATDTELRDALEGMREVRELLATLEVVRAPRSFALTAPAAPARPTGFSRLGLVTRIGAAVASLAFVVVLVGDLSGGGTPVTVPGAGADDSMSLAAAVDEGGAERSSDKVAPADATAANAAADSGPAGAVSPEPPAAVDEPTAEPTAEVATAELNSTPVPGAGTDGSSDNEAAPTSDPDATPDGPAPSATNQGDARDSDATVAGTPEAESALSLQADTATLQSPQTGTADLVSGDNGEVSSLAIVLGLVTGVLAVASGLFWWRSRDGAGGPI